MKTENMKNTENQVPAKRKGRKRKVETEPVSSANRIQEIGKKYERIPHPTLKNTFILREKK